MKTKLFYSLLSLLLIVTLAGCDIFDDDDVKKPNPGGNGALTVKAVQFTSITLSWTSTGTANHEYSVYVSESSIPSIDAMIKYGRKIVDWTANISEALVTGLNAGTAYKINVMVKNKDGGKASYRETNFTTTTEGVLGYWKSSFGDGFEIINESYPPSFHQYDDAAKKVSFAGEIVNSAVEGKTGFLTIKITESGSWGKTKGKFLVARWKDLDPDSMIEATAFKTNSEKNECETATEAETEQTIDNGYFDFFSTEYLKQ